jgi:hypothetical protein
MRMISSPVTWRVLNNNQLKGHIPDLGRNEDTPQIVRIFYELAELTFLKNEMCV